MKATITAILALAGAATVAAADFPANMPDCGKTCGGNMLAKAAELGCNNDDIACLCNNKDFGYGIRDCSLQVCNDVNLANIAIGWGNNLCAGVGAPANIPTATAGDGSTGASSSPVTGGDSTATASSTGSGSDNGSSGDATAVTTETWTSTFTSGSETNTVTGTTTLSGISGVVGATSAPETTVTTPVVSTQPDGSETTLGTSTLVSSITGDALSSALESQASASASASSSTSSGLGAQVTAAPVLGGVLAAAGIAAAFL